MEVQGPADAVDVPHDLQHDVPVDVPTDAVPGVPCVESGVSYNAGDVIPRGTNLCPTSCLCLAGGVIGACTGVCPNPDAPTEHPTDGDACTAQPQNFGSCPLEGQSCAGPTACRSCNGALGLWAILPAWFCTCAANTVGGSEGLYWACANAPVCTRGPSTGYPTFADSQCTIPSVSDAGTDERTDAGDAGLDPAESLCLHTMGQVSSALCCAATSDFPGMCAVGTCTCSPTNSHPVTTCACPTGSCFDTTFGCAGPAGVCTVGDDQTCNDNIALNAFHGHCLTGGRCGCIQGSNLVAASGKCS